MHVGVLTDAAEVAPPGFVSAAFPEKPKENRRKSENAESTQSVAPAKTPALRTEGPPAPLPLPPQLRARFPANSKKWGGPQATWQTRTHVGGDQAEAPINTGSQALK